MTKRNVTQALVEEELVQLIGRCAVHQIDDPLVLSAARRQGDPIVVGRRRIRRSILRPTARAARRRSPPFAVPPPENPPCPASSLPRTMSSAPSEQLGRTAMDVHSSIEPKHRSRFDTGLRVAQRERSSRPGTGPRSLVTSHNMVFHMDPYNRIDHGLTTAHARTRGAA